MIKSLHVIFLLPNAQLLLFSHHYYSCFIQLVPVNHFSTQFACTSRPGSDINPMISPTLHLTLYILTRGEDTLFVTKKYKAIYSLYIWQEKMKYIKFLKDIWYFVSFTFHIRNYRNGETFNFYRQAQCEAFCTVCIPSYA